MDNKHECNTFYEIKIKMLEERAKKLQQKIDYQRHTEVNRLVYRNEIVSHDLECAKVLIEEGVDLLEGAQPWPAIVESYVESAKAFLNLDFETTTRPHALTLSQQADEVLRKARQEINANRNM